MIIFRFSVHLFYFSDLRERPSIVIFRIAGDLERLGSAPSMRSLSERPKKVDVRLPGKM